MSFAGYDGNISYCPICGNNNFHENGSGIAQKYSFNMEYLETFHCRCGWQGKRNELLTKETYKQIIRKYKLQKLNESTL